MAQTSDQAETKTLFSLMLALSLFAQIKNYQDVKNVCLKVRSKLVGPKLDCSILFFLALISV